ncbi:hypothetical protein [Eisenbergiella massiliensis]|uniref:hypothetical protein n=1 Tax=Eisenbergiella massiliensis TaxID=1720294 RepID=UPI0004B42591|nr:hypothetical protein [Eisenbergiella massiliensis]
MFYMDSGNNIPDISSAQARASGGLLMLQSLSFLQPAPREKKRCHPAALQNNL